MRGERSRLCKVAVGVAVFLALTPVGKAEESSTADLAKAAQNPLASMISLPFQNNTDTNVKVGPEEKTQNILNIQPVWPIEWNDNWNLITRTIIPLISQPAMSATDSRENGLGDISFSGFFSPKESGKWIWGAGPVALLPTGADKLTQDKWGLGPTAVALTFNGPWVYGGLINNIWSVSGSGAKDINLMTLQPFLSITTCRGGAISPVRRVITANWEKRQRRAMDRTGGLRLRQDFQAWKRSRERADQPLSQR